MNELTRLAETERRLMMKWFNVIAIGAMAFAAMGCDGNEQYMTTEKAPLNRAMIQHHYNRAQDQAIRTQQTLFPYHFEHNGNGRYYYPAMYDQML